MRHGASSTAARRAIGKAAFLGAVAGAGFAAGKVHSVLSGLTSARRPFVWRPGRGRSVLLKGADVVDVNRGQVLRKRGLLLRDGRIVDLVPTRDLEKVDSDYVFDCGGLLAMPGLINCHCHLMMPCASHPGAGLILSAKRQWERNLEECALRGVTTVRDAGALSGVMNELVRRTENFEILGPRIFPCGAMLMAEGGYPDFAQRPPEFIRRRYGDLGIYVYGPEDARSAVRTSLEQGARFIKIFFDDRSLFFGHRPLNTLDDESVRAIVDEAHSLGLRVGVHQSQVSGFRRAVELGVDDLEHIPGDAVLTGRDVERFMEGRHNITPTVTVSVVFGIAPEGHPSRSDPFLDMVQREREIQLRQSGPAMSEEAVVRANMKMVRMYEEGSPADSVFARTMFDNELGVEGIINGSRNIRLLHEAGASFCCGNDGGTPLSFPGALYLEMKYLSELGFTNHEVIRSATANAAGLLGMDDELGSLESGRLADVLLLSANPLKDLGAVERVEGVFREGVLLHRGPALKLPS